MLSNSLLTLLLLVQLAMSPPPPPPRDFYAERQAILEAEGATFLGANLTLDPTESTVNDHLMSLKHAELDIAFSQASYPPSYSFFQSKSAMESSDVFSFLLEMPKGAALHMHDFSLASADWVIREITYREKLYVCIPEDMENHVPFFTWISSPDLVNEVPIRCSPPPPSGWQQVSEVRSQMGAEQFDSYLKSHLVLTVDDPATVYPDVNTVWAAFENKLGVMNSIIFYEPVTREYVRRALEEFRVDNVQYMEIRSTLPEEVCSEMWPTCNPLTREEVLLIFKEESEQFVKDNSQDMCGVKLIFAPLRRVSDETVSDYLTSYSDMQSKYPEFLVGFDLVGQEDLGRPLVDFADQLVKAKQESNSTQYFFHAGETDWQGEATDLNVMDALLLGTKRIGHGYAIAKHPESKRLALERGVPIEVNPISNQVLGLVHDLRNHPAVPLIQEGFPMVISSDDPATWEASALTYDFYEAFMGMASRDMDLRLLKKLVFSSLKEYAAINSQEERDACVNLLRDKWDKYMEQVLEDEVEKIIKHGEEEEEICKHKVPFLSIIQ